MPLQLVALNGQRHGALLTLAVCPLTVARSAPRADEASERGEAETERERLGDAALEPLGERVLRVPLEERDRRAACEREAAQSRTGWPRSTRSSGTSSKRSPAGPAAVASVEDAFAPTRHAPASAPVAAAESANASTSHQAGRIAHVVDRVATRSTG